MKKRHLIILIIFAISNLAFDCGEKSYPYYINNQWESTILTYEAIGGKGTYPDTILSFTKGYVLPEIYTNKVYIKSSFVIPIIDWVRQIPSDTLSIYIFSKDTLDKYSWQEIQEGYKLLKRYDLSVEDLEALNCTIPYPPTKRMKDMKMYPPYYEE